MRDKKYNGLISILIVIVLIITFIGCDWGRPEGTDSLKGWQLTAGNTGLCGDYSNLELIYPSTPDPLVQTTVNGVGFLFGGTLYITKPDVIISHKLIAYPVLVQTTGVRIEHCLIRPSSCGRGVPVVQVDDSIIRDSEIDCENIPLAMVGFSIIVNGSNCIIERNNIHGGSTGISIVNTSDLKVSIAQGNYIHGLRLFIDPDTGESAHIDGLTIRESSGKGLIVKNNYIETAPAATGPLFIQAWRGHIDNVIVEGNLLQGQGYCIALEYNAHGYGRNMQAKNNRFDAWTIYGGGPAYESIQGGTGWNVWSKNYAYDANAYDCKGVLIQ